VSFQMIVQRLGIFEYNPIISNEELEKIESFNRTEWMPVFVKEVVLGSAVTLSQQAKMADNNNKYKNLLLVKEDEQQVYLCPSAVDKIVDKQEPDKPVLFDVASNSVSNVKSSVSSNNEQNEKRLLAEFRKVRVPSPRQVKLSQDEEMMKASMSSGQNQSSGGQKNSMQSEGSSSGSFFKRSEFLDPLSRINTLKFMTSNDLKVSANVRFALLDLRHVKKPKL